MSVLTDVEILAAMRAGGLVRGGETGRVGPACYELRAGPIYYDLTESDRRIDASAQGTILIKPGHRVVLISLEEVIVPANLLARISSKGSLFSVGLSPVSTYADPGFQGHLGIVTQNMGSKYLVVPIGEPIAKVDFSRTASPVQTPYRGQHGYQTRIWPIRHDLQKSHDEVRSDPRVKSEIEEADIIIPAATALALQRMRNTQRLFFAFLISIVIANSAMFAYLSGGKWGEFWFAIGTNLLASILFAAAFRKSI